MYAILDIESNGGAYRKESIIEIAIYQFDGHKITDQFSSMVNPEAEISPFVQKLTGITPKMVKTAPKFHELAKRIIEITEDTTLVGHNVDFDYRMLKQSFKQLGYDFQRNTIDTIPLAQKLIPNEGSYSLGKLSKSLGFPIADRHRAAGDARATLDLFKLLLSKDESQEIIQQHQQENKSKSYINKIKSLTEDLPATKGIVYFQNRKGDILHTEYADDMFKFAKKIFHSPSKKWVKVQNQTEHISYDLVATELLAALIINTKQLSSDVHFPYGLTFEQGHWAVRKHIKYPILRFKTISQAKKALNYIENKPFSELELYDLVNVKDKNILLTGTGRTRGEKSFIFIEHGTITGYGFYDWFSQISTRENIMKRCIIVSEVPKSLWYEFQLSLLKQEFKIQAIPD
ncbi:3'-5' exonuclease [Riemerella columbina]|uniref:3'-5' exonuclease n=1 Tax=Riemerella columbina TaxID=103810 RepID=UPI000371BAF2|nr:3'-5' exonuclease [Riemerella columbina]